MTTRAKFRVDSVRITEESVFDHETQQPVRKQVATIELHPVTGASAENEKFYASTPSCSITLNIVNLEAAVMFKQGEELYVDFFSCNESTFLTALNRSK